MIIVGLVKLVMDGVSWALSEGTWKMAAGSGTRHLHAGGSGLMLCDRRHRTARRAV
jgi:hypothetical protein